MTTITGHKGIKLNIKIGTKLRIVTQAELGDGLTGNGTFRSAYKLQLQGKIVRVVDIDRDNIVQIDHDEWNIHPNQHNIFDSLEQFDNKLFEL